MGSKVRLPPLITRSGCRAALNRTSAGKIPFSVRKTRYGRDRQTTSPRCLFAACANAIAKTRFPSERPRDRHRGLPYLVFQAEFELGAAGLTSDSETPCCAWRASSRRGCARRFPRDTSQLRLLLDAAGQHRAHDDERKAHNRRPLERALRNAHAQADQPQHNADDA